MKRQRLAVLGALLLVACVVGWGDPAPRAYLERVIGTVRVQRSAQGSWLSIAGRASLYSGDLVQTYQQSSATILIDHNRVELGPRTRVRIPAARAPRVPSGARRLMNITGKVLLWIIGKQDVEVGTAGAVAAASGTKFVLEADENGLTTITVLEGEVAFYNDLGRVTVRTGEQSQASPTSAPTRPMATDPSAYLQWEATLENAWLDIDYRHFPSESVETLKRMAEEARRQADASPNDAEAQIRAGDVLDDLGDFSAAEAYYRKALDLAPDSRPARLSLGYNLLGQGRAADAEATLQTAAEAAPNTAAPFTGLAAARLALPPKPGTEGPAALLRRALAAEPQSALAHAVAGLAAIRAGDAAGARQSLNQALAADPGCFQADCYLSTVELAEGKADAAVAAARHAVELAPASSLAHASLATAAFFGGDITLAKSESALALELDPASAAAHLVASDIYVTEGELSWAADEAGLAAALDPSCAPAYSALGMIALAQNDLGTAERSFTRALELSPNLVAARTGMGVTYSRQGKLARALEQQKAAIALDSGSAATENNLGAIHLAEGRLEEAVAAFTKAIDLQPQWAMPHANLAIAYLDLNRFAEAVREGEQAVRLGEESARVHTTLGRVYLEQNRVNKAWAALRRAVELDGTYALAHLELAEVYLRLGRARDARREQLEAIALQPSAMLETREYARTEARVEVGSFDAQLRTDGRADDGRSSYFVSAEHENDDWNRPHSLWTRTTAQGILGRQSSADRATAVLFSVEHETRDRPGSVSAGGLPEDPDYESAFTAYEGHALARIGNTDQTHVTLKLGLRSSTLDDTNPDSLSPDPKPFRDMKIRFSGPLAEARLDQRISSRDHLTAGLAASLERRDVSGTVGTPRPAPDPPTWTPFADTDRRNAVTFYLEHEHRLSDRTRVMLGGRLATTEGTTPVLRPKAWVHHDLGGSGTVVLLTRPMLRDDVSELSPVDYWALSDGLSPLDFADGGFGQSYELQYELMPRNGSLLRVAGFHRTLRSYLVDLTDPVWAPGEAAAILPKASLSGAEAEFEHWVTRDLSVGAWVRYTESDSAGTGGLEVPFQPRLVSLVRLDYISPSGLRAGARWRHIGSRYADLANATKAGSYEVLDLSAAYQVNLHTDLFLGIDNVLDEDDGFYPGYPSRGRWIRGGVEYRF